MSLYDGFFPKTIHINFPFIRNVLTLERIDDLPNFGGARVTYSLVYNGDKFETTVDVSEVAMASDGFRNYFSKAIANRIAVEIREKKTDKIVIKLDKRQ